MTVKSMFFCKEADDLLKVRVDILAKAYAIKYVRRFAKEYITVNISVLLSDSEYLTSKEVMSILKISRSTLNRRIKNGELNPFNPDAGRNYRFIKSEVYNLK